MRNICARGLWFGIALAAAIVAGAAVVFAQTPEPSPAGVDEAGDRFTPEPVRPPAIDWLPPMPGVHIPQAMVPPRFDAAPGPGPITQATTPTPRYIGTGIVDPIRNRFIVFGGLYLTAYQSGPALNEVWALPLSGPPTWSQLAPAGDPLAGLPSPRYGHTAIYDPVRDRMIVFGGYDVRDLNDVWALSLSGNPAWTKLAPAGTPPVPRYYASALYDPVRDRMILYGGIGAYPRDYVSDNGVWELSLSGTPTWSLLETPGERPAGRYLHSAIYDPVRDRIVVCGGAEADNFVWALPLGGAAPWQRIATSGGSPLPRVGHSGIYDATGDRMVLFGGSTGVSIHDDTWSLPLGGDPTWSRVVSSTPPPAPRGSHSAACDTAGARLIVFGGPRLNDTWVLPLRGAPAWSMIAPLDPPAPTAPVPTFADTLSGIPATLYVGQTFTLTAVVRNDGVASDDGRIVFGFPSLNDPGDAAQVTSTSAGDLPGFRVHPAGSGIDGAACQPLTASYLVAEYADDDWPEFGGETRRFDLRVTPRAAGTFTIEVRSTMRAAGGPACDPANGLPANGEAGAVDQQGWAVKRYAITVLPLPAPGSAPVRRRLHSAVFDPVRNRMLVFGGWVGAPSGETWALSLDGSPTWSLLLTDVGPSPRYGHTAIYDPVRDRMIVFGGFDDARRNDVWALALSGPPTWTRINPVTGPAPTPRRYHTAIYDPVRDRMVVFGGSSDYGDQDDVWALDLAGDPRWINYNHYYPRPGWRKHSAAVYDPVRDRMLVFGGLLGTSTPYDDLWALSLSGETWTQLGPVGGRRPSPRSGHTLTYDPSRDRVWMVGGNTGTYERDTWTYSPAFGTWEQEGTWGGPLPEREMHTTIADPGADRLVVYGGTDSLGRLGDTWFLSRSEPPIWRKLGASPPPPPPADPTPIFTDQVRLLPASITIGQSFQVTVVVRNDGFPSDDARISLAFPELASPGDSQWVSTTRVADHPGLVKTQAGGTLRSATCQSMTAPYLVAEYADSNWQGFGVETDTVTFTVQPRAVGPFHFDLRATMHRAGGPGCEVANAVPYNGEGGHTDPQGWAVKRFTMAVLPPNGASGPVFTNSSPSRLRMTLGQTFTMNLSVRNDGVSSDDGRIVLGFPDFTATGDSANVSCAAGTAVPGYRELPAGTLLSDSTCAPVVASYLTAEYVDNDWHSFGSEYNTMVVTVQPREAGTFTFYVRATLHTAGLGACAFVNGVPYNGERGITDQQGWAVRRYIVRVDPPPTAARPEFLDLQLGPTQLVISQTVYLSIRATNLGLASDDGRIVVGFPSFTDSADVDRVGRYYDEWETYREMAAGSAGFDSLCSPRTRDHLSVELFDNDWQWVGEESHRLELLVQPRSVGTFYIDIRSTMRTAGAGACAYVNAVPSSGDTLVVDSEGWLVRRFAVTVAEQPPPVPTLGGFYATPSPITLGQTLTVSSSASNQGWASDDGRICISFPSLTAAADADLVAPPSSWGNQPWYHEHAAGDTIERSDCQPMTASHVMVEFVTSQWSAQTQQGLLLQVTPRDTGTFVVQLRATMHWSVGGPCDYASVPQAGDTDQQGWHVQTVTVRVNPPPPTGPAFANLVSLPGTISLGEGFLVSAAVRNDGSGSNDGRISFAFPNLTDPADGQQVSGAGAGDLPGYVKRPAGSTLNTAACQSVAAGYLVAEYVDNDWRPGETNTASLMVQPKAQGTFYVDVRATMHDTAFVSGPCHYPNAVPANGAAGITDPQGWVVKRFAIQVGPPPGPPSMTWAPIFTGGVGPAARALQAAAYDEVRDELVLYGGASEHYVGDSWSLPLVGSSWSLMSPGGPVPIRRIGHSMVFNPTTSQLLIFGGTYINPMNDLWVLARAPTAWWFPIAVPGTEPGVRMGHAALYDPVRQRMLMIGGFGDQLENDVWEYSPLSNGTWHLLTPSGTAMPGRANFSAVYDPVRDRVLIFGGDGGYVLNDVWELTLGAAPAWNRITPAGVAPGARREHTAVYDAQWDEMVVFGGFDGTRWLNDTWTLSLSGTPRWEHRSSLSPPPVPRAGHSAIYDPVRQRVVVFGGRTATNEYSSELWELKIDRATPVALSLAETEVESDHVRLTWFGEGAASLAARVERSTGEDGWFEVGTPSPEGPDRLVFVDRDVSEGTRYAYRLRVWQDGKEEELGPVWVTVPARAVLSLAGASPNPATDVLAVTFSLPSVGEGALELFDLRGRRVARQDLAGMAAGPHRVALADARHLGTGVYWVRLTHGSQHLTAKAAVVR